MKTYADPQQEITARRGERFALELEGNPTTGYTWRLAFDESRLRLDSHKFRRASGAVGAGGAEVFVLEALAPGPVTIRADYQRPWETKPVSSRQFHASVTG